MTGMPADLPRIAGWYEGGILFTHVPEAYFGEPMVLFQRGDRVVRAYPAGPERYTTAEGAEIVVGQDSLTVDGQVCQRLSAYAERQVEFQAGEDTLHGSVIVPAGPGPHPAAVLLHGAAGGQRDFCRFQAGPILEAGVAVLIYDKAGHGLSGGKHPTIFEQAIAAEAGMRLLAAQPGIDPGRIGIAGFSNGMWAAPMAAARNQTAFLVGVGAPGVSMAESEVHRRTKVLREAGVGAESVAAAGEGWRAIFAIASDGPTNELRQALSRALSTLTSATDLDRYDVPAFVRQQPMLSPIPPLMPVDDLVAMLGDERDPELGYDPAADYAKLSCPVFLQYGAEDTSVPVAVSVERVGPYATVRVYPGVEHMLNLLPAERPGMSAEEVMYQFHDFSFAPGAWAELTAWLRTAV
jgi:pimeloyl-ACP methyl ester carboxylesterase